MGVVFGAPAISTVANWRWSIAAANPIGMHARQPPPLVSHINFTKSAHQGLAIYGSAALRRENGGGPCDTIVSRLVKSIACSYADCNSLDFHELAVSAAAEDEFFNKNE